MRILKWLFNLLRNVSLLLVLTFIAALFFFAVHPDQLAVFRNSAEQKAGIASVQRDGLGLAGHREQGEADSKWSLSSFGTMADFEAESGDEEEAFGAYSIGEDEEKEVSGNQRSVPAFKEKIKTTKGVAFLKPSGIISITAGKPNHTITTVNNQKIEVSERVYSLQNLFDIFNKEGRFFKTKKEMVNVDYVEQIISDEYGVKKIVMEKGNSIHLPDAQYQPLLQFLESL